MSIDMNKMKPSGGPIGRTPVSDRSPVGSEKISDTLTGPRFHELLREQMPTPVAKAPVSSEAAAALEALTNKAGAPQTPREPSLHAPVAAPLAPLNARGLQSAVAPGTAVNPLALKFSNHAMERIRSRGINIAPHMDKIMNAVERASQKGSKDTLVLTPDAALIVNVKNRTVVTAMDRATMKENVFTNIDSTVMI